MRSGLMDVGRPVQTELFPLAAPAHPDPAQRNRQAPRKVPSRKSAVPGLSTIDDEVLAWRLEETGRFRILRQLQPRLVSTATWPAADASAKIGIILDTETTGLDHKRDEIIELGMVAFTYSNAGIADVIGVFSALREPTVPISAEITRITGITAEMVAGQVIDPDAVVRFGG